MGDGESDDGGDDAARPAIAENRVTWRLRFH